MGVVTGAGGEPRADDPRRVRRQGGEPRRVDVPVAGERAADDFGRMVQGSVDDGVGQVTALAHQQAGVTGRWAQQAYQHVGGRCRIEGDAAQPTFVQGVGHRVILSPQRRRTDYKRWGGSGRVAPPAFAVGLVEIETIRIKY